MGDNETRLVQAYLALQKEFEETESVVDRQIMLARLQGIKFGYETYVSHVNPHYGSIEYLIERYHYINGRGN